MTVIPDGRHDVLVVDAETDDEGRVHFELALTTGPNKGDVVRITGPVPAADAVAASADPIHLLGLPATLVVEDGRPRLLLE